MPPIPQTLDDETKELIEGLRRRERDLSDYQVTRLRDCKGPLSVQQRFAAELREDLDVFGKQIDVLEIRAEDVVRKVDRLALLQLAEEFRESSATIRKEMRAALLHSKKSIDAQAKSNREELFSAAVPDSRNVEEKATDDALMKASNDVTNALRRTVGLMQTELERSVLSHQLLEESTATLRATSAQHDIISYATQASKQLITALERADWLDRLLVFAALAFFVLVVLFILKQRLLDRGIRIAFWWTRFLPLSGTGKVLDVEKGRISASVVSAVRSSTQVAKEAASTVITQASTAVASSSSDLSDSVVDITSEVLPSSESIYGSIIETLSSSMSVTTASTTASDALSETTSLIQHAEL